MIGVSLWISQSASGATAPSRKYGRPPRTAARTAAMCDSTSRSACENSGRTSERRTHTALPPAPTQTGDLTFQLATYLRPVHTALPPAPHPLHFGFVSSCLLFYSDSRERSNES